MRLEILINEKTKVVFDTNCIKLQEKVGDKLWENVGFFLTAEALIKRLIELKAASKKEIYTIKEFVDIYQSEAKAIADSVREYFKIEKE